MGGQLDTSLFVLDPPQFITFEVNSAGPKEAILTLTNTSDNTLAYKVKISPRDKRNFIVQPSAAVVRRKAKIRFTITAPHVAHLLEQYKSEDADSNQQPQQQQRRPKTTKFLLQILHLPPSFFDAIKTQSEISASVEQEWRKIAGDRKRLSNTKLCARFVFPSRACLLYTSPSPRDRG